LLPFKPSMLLELPLAQIVSLPTSPVSELLSPTTPIRSLPPASP
jgi:hypothetical protein